jgi:hypothetical protein
MVVSLVSSLILDEGMMSKILSVKRSGTFLNFEKMRNKRAAAANLQSVGQQSDLREDRPLAVDRPIAPPSVVAIHHHHRSHITDSEAITIVAPW